MVGFAGTRNWIYTQSVDGRYQRLRRWTFFGLHLILFVTPWVMIGGHPALRVDLEDRRLYAFGTIFTATDTIFLLLLLLFLAFSLFFFTSLFGRLWCGYGCPQTVLLDTWVRPIERWIEGDGSTRRRRDQKGLHWDLVWRKAAKWTLFAVAAVITSMAFMSFFAGARELWTGQAGPVAYALVGIFAAAWFADFTWFREQFCNFLCPYARFQSALTDDRTIMVGYNLARGEPRGGKQARFDGRCIDCSRCVAVCPQGIDIRNGFQLECINCARCVDACTAVMGKLGHESLISYGSLTCFTGTGGGARNRMLRPRTAAYGLLLLGILGAGAVLLANRAPFEAAVTRAPGSLFTMDADGYVRNTYLLRLTNNMPGGDPVPFRVAVEGIEGAEVVTQPVALRSEESRMLPLVVRLPAARAEPRTIPIRVRVSTPTDERVLDATFKTGGKLVAGT